MDKWTGKKFRRREVRIPEDWLEFRTPQKVDPRLPSDWRGKSFFSARSMSPVCFLCSYEQLDVLHIRYLSNRYQRWSQIDITFVAWPAKALHSLRAFNKFTKNERQRTDYVQNALLPYKKDFWKPFCCSWSVGKHCLWNYFHRGLVPNLCGLGFRFPS